jgi:hypothetical protein
MWDSSRPASDTSRVRYVLPPVMHSVCDVLSCGMGCLEVKAMRSKNASVATDEKALRVQKNSLSFISEAMELPTGCTFATC